MNVEWPKQFDKDLSSCYRPAKKISEMETLWVNTIRGRNALRQVNRCVVIFDQYTCACWREVGGRIFSKNKRKFPLKAYFQLCSLLVFPSLPRIWNVLLCVHFFYLDIYTPQFQLSITFNWAFYSFTQHPQRRLSSRMQNPPCNVPTPKICSQVEGFCKKLLSRLANAQSGWKSSSAKLVSCLDSQM